MVLSIVWIFVDARKLKGYIKGENLTLCFNVTDVLALSTNKAQLITDTVAEKEL